MFRQIQTLLGRRLSKIPHLRSWPQSVTFNGYIHYESQQRIFLWESIKSGLPYIRWSNYRSFSCTWPVMSCQACPPRNVRGDKLTLPSRDPKEEEEEGGGRGGGRIRNEWKKWTRPTLAVGEEIFFEHPVCMVCYQYHIKGTLCRQSFKWCITYLLCILPFMGGPTMHPI